MESKNIYKKIAVHTCIYFTGITFLMTLLYLCLSRDLSNGIQALALVCFLLFSLAFALANIQFKDAGYGITLKTVIHYILTVGAAFCCLYLPNKNPQQGASNGFIMFLILTVVYAIVMGVILGVRARIKRVTRDEGHYKSVYKQGKEKAERAEKTERSDKKQKDDYQNVFKK